MELNLIRDVDIADRHNCPLAGALLSQATGMPGEVLFFEGQLTSIRPHIRFWFLLTQCFFVSSLVPLLRLMAVSIEHIKVFFANEYLAWTFVTSSPDLPVLLSS